MKPAFILFNYIAVVFLLSFFSCRNKNEDLSLDVNTSRGVFVVNEGNFMFGNASLTFVDYDNNISYPDLFFPVNNIPLGDVAHSMTVQGDRAYVVVNNSGTVIVINSNTGEYIDKISGLTSPRYFHLVNNEKAYISDLYSSEIGIYNPMTLEKTGSINIANHHQQFLQHTSEQFIQWNNLVFVNSWSFDQYILVIDTEKDLLVDSIAVPIQPKAMVMDRNDKLWVLTDGGYQGSSYGHISPVLYKIDAASRTKELSLEFTSANNLPGDMVVNSTSDTLFFINRDIFAMPVLADKLPDLPLIKAGKRNFYALYFHHELKRLLVSDAVDFLQHGYLYSYTPLGNMIDSIETGINPGFICKK